jgi:TetR/AcrR family transcriptional regulator, cholesterol catabolism regulator
MKIGAEPSSRSKRDIILRVAAEEFGRNGFDATMWARIAERAGIGNTALYHYFESKTHCLFTLLQESNGAWHERWSACLVNSQQPVDAVLDAVRATFDCTEADAIKNRLLLNEQGKLTTIEAKGRTREAQIEALQLARRIEKLWIDFLTRAIESGAIPRQDPGVLAHAIIGLLQSVWGWYRPGGRRKLDYLRDRYCQYVRAMLTTA